MSWRDNLREASFRGVPFFYDDTDADHGRRFYRHEYAGQDEVYHEDLGLKTRVHSLNAYVWGPNCDVEATNLRGAIEKPGAGTLVHPIIGEVRVAVTSARERTSTREGGMVTFTITFEETGEARRPQVSPLPVARIDAASENALTAIQFDFENSFSVDTLPQFVADDAADQVAGLIDTIKTAFANVRQSEQTLAGWVNRAADIKTRAQTLVRDPSSLALEIAKVIGVPLDLPGAQLARSLDRLFDFGQDVPAIVATTATRHAQLSNRVSFNSLIRQTAVIHAARASVRESYPHRTAALERRDRIADVLEGETLTAPDTSYGTLVKLRTEVVKGIDAQAAKLPRLKTVQPAVTRPALALAHELYGDNPDLVLAMSDDLVVRNNLRHPGFVPGGNDLEVMIDV